MIKQFKIAGLRYITIFMTAEICYFSTHITPPVTIVTEHKTQFFTHFSKKNIFFFYYFKGLFMTHHLDIFMSGKNLGLNGLILLVNEYLNLYQMNLTDYSVSHTLIYLWRPPRYQNWPPQIDFFKKLWLRWINISTARFKIETRCGCLYITVFLKETDCLQKILDVILISSCM